ncbi:alpha/beta fold hydrolase [Variovorax saccharolyticus]|uniref:alpha/beta fold hydrolase n=1 Tax=Variovorax saccharolyticus TaxID=3053516 RepID=UPI00336A9EA9
MTHHRTVEIDAIKVFYPEAGDRANPSLLLLHGFPTFSHVFRHLLPILATDFHGIAPYLPGFGFSDSPPPNGVQLHLRQSRESHGGVLAKGRSPHALVSTCSTTVHRWVSAWRLPSPSG